jgi:hypothetical protein
LKGSSRPVSAGQSLDIYAAFASQEIGTPRQRLGNAVDDLIGWCDEAAAAAAEGQKPLRHPLDGYGAREKLALAHDRFIRLDDHNIVVISMSE